MKYECSVCGYIYDEDSEATPWNGLDDDWGCPICSADKSYFERHEESSDPGDESSAETTAGAPSGLDDYLSVWKRSSDDFEGEFAAIQHMAVTG